MAKNTSCTKQNNSLLNYNDLENVVDCQFLDSYGIPVKHGSKIII